MKVQKRNESVELLLSLEHSQSVVLSSSLVTEVAFKCSAEELSVSISSDSFSDLRARWNSVMRALIASEQSLDSTNGGA